MRTDAAIQLFQQMFCREVTTVAIKGMKWGVRKLYTLIRVGEGVEGVHRRIKMK